MTSLPSAWTSTEKASSVALSCRVGCPSPFMAIATSLPSEKESALIFEASRRAGPNPERIPLVRIEDRHGNAHNPPYGADGRLSPPSRITRNARLRFLYGDCGLLERGSPITLAVDWHSTGTTKTAEHLVGVTTPATSEYPDGGSTPTYEYDGLSTLTRRLIHNLTQIAAGPNGSRRGRERLR